jgi:hypothetical protein
MVIEAVSQLSRMFSIELPLEDLLEHSDIDALVTLLVARGRGGGTWDGDETESTRSGG